MKLIGLIFISLFIMGCASQSVYKAAKGDSSGYKEIALAQNHYRVQFKLAGQSRSAAQKYAMKRAAELTLAQGYDWFVVEKTSTRRLREEEPFAPSARPTIARSCGLLGCRTQMIRPESARDFADTDTLAIIEIRMGRGVRPESGQSERERTENKSYDARELWEKIN
ncbi:CC0125/CC1285 family lipoprotein [Cellvibrio sp. OA-2007]|uniref:CC0125/CC1285 family lipoprotein n=1 Tax=Cellvibrio sp. OA-2007 TaxID=529823 RepID=UPI00078153B0|nr:hypothetical protein [Cellvibrio sp. OA-2007]